MEIKLVKRVKIHAAAMLLSIAAWGPVTSVYAADKIVVTDAWVRGTAVDQKAAGVFMTLTSPKDAQLTAVSSPVAQSAGIHSMQQDDKGVMRMRAESNLALPAGHPVMLKPGGMHLMLIGLKSPLEPGKQVPLTLTFKYADNASKAVQQKVLVPVEPITANGAPAKP